MLTEGEGVKEDTGKEPRGAFPGIGFMTFMTQVFRGAAKGSRMAKYRTFEGHPERAVRRRRFGSRARPVWAGCAGKFLLLLLLALPAVVQAQFT